MSKKFLVVNFVAVLLALVVVTLGAYTRLSDAGLGCPDWPGCYGHLGSPTTAQQIATAKQRFPGQKIEPEKGWKEMIHRYFAGALGLLILVLAALAFRFRRENPKLFRLSLALVVLVVFQALLGMWTVTQKLQPLIVTAHLLFGFTTLSLLWVMFYSQRHGKGRQRGTGRGRGIILIGILVLVLQIALGGWTGSNYAAVSCTDFPTCYNQQWFPLHDFKEAFQLWRELGVNYEFGKLEPAARITIHMTHRIGALVTFLTLLSVGVWVLLKRPEMRRNAWLLFAGLGVQIALGITIVLKARPLYVAVGHNATAALLLLILLTLYIENRYKHSDQAVAGQ